MRTRTKLSKCLFLAILLVIAVVGTPSSASAQTDGTGPGPVQVSGAVNINTKGISQVPALTLGRPAAIFDLAVRKGAFGFEPQFRFGLDGKPWSFLLWGRYRAVNGEKFRLTVGGHPAFSFRTTEAAINGASRDFIEVRRYIAGELTPTYALTPNLGVGGYYLYSHGIDVGAPKHTHLVAARTNVSNLELFHDYVVQLAPQIYFLRTNGQNGTYVSASVSFGRSGWPISIGTIVNQPIRTDVAGGQDFLWNVSLNYAFR